MAGFPFLFAGIEHLNVCNNRGTPLHIPGDRIDQRKFLEVWAEYRLALFKGVEAAAFVDWNLYQGHCSMTIERHEGGATPGVTSGTVAWSHDISSLTVGGKWRCRGDCRSNRLLLRLRSSESFSNGNIALCF